MLGLLAPLSEKERGLRELFSEQPEAFDVLIRARANSITFRHAGSEPPTDFVLTQPQLDLVDTISPRYAGMLFTYAAWHGDVWLCRALVKRHPYPRLYRLDPAGVAPGKPDLAAHFGTKGGLLQRKSNLCEILTLIQDLEGSLDFSPESLANPKTRWFELLDSDLLKPWQISRTEYTNHYDFHLPILTAEGLEYPDVVNVLDKLAYAKGRHRSWYDDVLCWATPVMVEQNWADLFPYQAVHDVVLHVSGYPDGLSKRMPIVEYRKLFEAGVLMPAIHQVEIGVLATRPGADVTDELLLGYFLNSAQRLGFDWPEGMVLCRTTRQFLEGQKWLKSWCVKNTEEAFANYLPIDLLAAKVPGSKYEIEGYLKPFQSRHLCGFLRTVATNQSTWPGLLAMYGKGLLDAMIRDEGVGPVTLDLVIFIQRLGLSTEDLTVSLSILKRYNLGRMTCDLVRIRDSLHGERPFPAGTAFKLRGAWSIKSDDAAALLELLARCELPVTVEGYSTLMAPASLMQEFAALQDKEGVSPVAPVAIFNGLNKLTSNPRAGLTQGDVKSRSVAALMLWKGVQPFLDLADSPDDWELLRQVFGNQALVPFIDRVGDATATKMMVTELL